MTSTMPQHLQPDIHGRSFPPTSDCLGGHPRTPQTGPTMTAIKQPTSSKTPRLMTHHRLRACVHNQSAASLYSCC
jgi:hypothetical protein